MGGPVRSGRGSGRSGSVDRLPLEAVIPVSPLGPGHHLQEKSLPFRGYTLLVPSFRLSLHVPLASPGRRGRCPDSQ